MSDKTFVWITGFPRSGTSWLFRQLWQAPEADCLRNEQGLGVLWKHRFAAAGRIDYDRIMRECSAIATHEEGWRIFLSGCFAAKHMQTNPIRTLNRLTATDKPCWLSKTPSMVMDDTFPDDYVKQSARWDRSVVICCKRDAPTTWESGLKKWPFWEDEFGWQKFERMHAKYYQAAEERGWLIVDHADAAGDPQRALNRVTDHLGWGRLSAEVFKVRTPQVNVHE